jgi:hypothetical protein
MLLEKSAVGPQLSRVCGLGLAISDKKNDSAEDEIDRATGLLRRNSGCSAEQKTIGIPFRTIPWKRKMLGIFYSGT